MALASLYYKTSNMVSCRMCAKLVRLYVRIWFYLVHLLLFRLLNMFCSRIPYTTQMYHVMWMQGECRGAGPNYKYVHNKLESKCSCGALAILCEHWGSCLVKERSMMRSSTLFECGPLPLTSTSRPLDVIHVTSVPRPSPILLLFCFCVLYWMQTKEQKVVEARKRGYQLLSTKSACCYKSSF